MGGFILQAVLRHLISNFGASLVATGILTAGQVDEFISLAITAGGALMSLAAMLWAGWKQTRVEKLNDAVAVPGVEANKTVIVVNDPALAAKTPPQVIFDPQLTSD